MRTTHDMRTYGIYYTVEDGPIWMAFEVATNEKAAMDRYVKTNPTHLPIYAWDSSPWFNNPTVVFYNNN